MPAIPAYQEPTPRKGWFRDYDGVPAIYVHPDDSDVYTFGLDQSLASDEYISAVSWASEGPTFTGATVATRAQGMVTFTGVPGDGEYVTIGDTAVTAKTTPTTQDHFSRAGALSKVIAAFVAAVNNGTESSNVSAVDNGDSTVTVTWLEYGTGGNSAVFAMGGSYANWSIADGSSGTFGGITTAVSAGGNDPVEGKSHSVTVTGSGDAVVTVTTTSGASVKRRYRWRPVPRGTEDYC